ncbi:MTOR-associated protein MEAK7 [Xenopus laevis]|uniref:MTOR-associated protein MEAK7 n=2 Tax=Xenopus laevis TaxID=8355 RepID=MEAK7_XENLA|nr:MTOR-associated protein MEAK7 [Xenopus laevis]Q6DDZ9.1 RecName: Full=MTOR-associated protein MEAK7; Short=MEAK7; AltName: Full=TBC/LysM-associated domain-containing protein 1; AltName: Full=TLD domain-containing protein 1 [Xenopus laevis]AAH77349.1 MGC81149 protein [Xenopus laevis]OCT84498.1 hypothetical protein XELAEV_18022651mg [Xenopus laevis]
MGNTESGSHQKGLSRILPEEKAEIEQFFENMCRMQSGPKKSVGLQYFQDALRNSLPCSISQRIFDGIQSVRTNSKSSTMSAEISKEQFLVFYVDLLRGTAEEKSQVICDMISCNNSEHMKGHQVQKFLEDIIAAVIYVLKQQSLLKGWNLENMRDCTLGTQGLAMQLLSQLQSIDGQKFERQELLDSPCSKSCIEDWLYKIPMISLFVRVMLTVGLSILKHHTEHQKDMKTLLPKCTGMKNTSFVSLLDLPAVMHLNYYLPYEVQHKWRLLFSSQIHGESFSQLCGHILDQGPCLLIVKDSDGFVFGGFASQSWKVKPQFQGDSRCFLFSISPRLDVYTYTGYNDHYMYLNRAQQSLPNGLGMGGQHEYFGFWIDSNFGIGHSKAKPSCTTYNSPQLSAKEEFSIHTVEVWAVGDVPEHLLAKNPRSILDSDTEARALLEMAGQTRQSDGLREVTEEDES